MGFIKIKFIFKFLNALNIIDDLKQNSNNALCVYSLYKVYDNNQKKNGKNKWECISIRSLYYI